MEWEYRELEGMKKKNATGPIVECRDMMSNCLGYLHVTDPTGFFCSVDFFREMFRVVSVHQVSFVLE